MEEGRAVNRIEANLPQEKIDFINAAYAEEVDYWKRAALGSKNEEERKQLTDLAHLKVFLACKDARKSSVENIYMLFYLRKNYSPILKSELALKAFRKMTDFHSKKCLIT